MGWNYLSIPKLQRCNRWSLGMDRKFHPIHYNGCNYLSMLGLKINHVSKRGHSSFNHCWEIMHTKVCKCVRYMDVCIHQENNITENKPPWILLQTILFYKTINLSLYNWKYSLLVFTLCYHSVIGIISDLELNPTIQFYEHNYIGHWFGCNDFKTANAHSTR